MIQPKEEFKVGGSAIDIKKAVVVSSLALSSLSLPIINFPINSVLSHNIETYCVDIRNSNEYHKMSCDKARMIKTSDLVKIDSKENAEKSGFIPCKICLLPSKRKPNILPRPVKLTEVQQSGILKANIEKFSSDGEYYKVLGYVTNGTKKYLKFVQVEAEFHDKKGSLSGTDITYACSTDIIQPSKKKAFSFSGRDPGDYDTVAVSIKDYTEVVLNRETRE